MQSSDIVDEGKAVDPPFAPTVQEQENENVQYPPFADDPFRGQPLSVTTAHIDDLNDQSFLKTSLIDYILRHVMPKDLPDEVLIGSSNSHQYFNTYNDKKDMMNTRTSKNEPESFNEDALRQKFQVYSLRRYRFLVANCDSGHFFVVSLVFDMERNKNPIYDVQVFDSMHKTRRRTRTSDAPSRSSPAGRYLLAFQKFMAQFVAFSTKHSNFRCFPVGQNILSSLR